MRAELKGRQQGVTHWIIEEYTCELVLRPSITAQVLTAAGPVVTSRHPTCPTSRMGVSMPNASHRPT
jgi:hypothetical protein